MTDVIHEQVAGTVVWVQKAYIYVTVPVNIQRQLHLDRPRVRSNAHTWGTQVAALTTTQRSCLGRVPVTFSLRRIDGLWYATDLQFDSAVVDSKCRNRFVELMGKYNLGVEMTGDKVVITFSDGSTHDFTYNSHNPDRTKDAIRRYAAKNGTPLPPLQAT